jgi:hypothetical protein
MKSPNRKAANVTYAVLVLSEQEERSAFETAVYLLLILSAVFSIWQVARQPITLTGDAPTRRAAVAQTISGQHQGV